MIRLFKISLIAVILSHIIDISSVFAQATLQEEFNKLKKQYELVVADRDNILAQTKGLLEYKNRYKELETEYDKLKKENDQLKIDLQLAKEQITNLQQLQGEWEITKGQLERENKELKASLEKVTVEYKMLPELRKELNSIKNENTALRRSMQSLEAKVKQLNQQKLNDDAQLEIYRIQIKDLKKRYEQALAKNRELEKRAQNLPKRFAELARENKMLIKETALMHYNLGVFYTKNKEFSRAIAEFEKAAELNPEDPAVYYNLGYIYAEYLVNRPKAIEYFKKYLGVAKPGDKDMDWVKKYIVTWETWEGKKPMK
ncbi:MAG: tetratricopeptide repeat protein [Candidatus Omnitrophica bacterium]|nr:tetratricopeptide repeat protein [Candidatus Omnitrophota bacterium]